MDSAALLPPSSGSGNDGASKSSVRMDRQFVLFMLNLSVALVLLVSVLVSQPETTLFTFEWTERLYADDDSLKLNEVALKIDRLYDNNTNFTSSNMGIMMDTILRGARCDPVALGSAASSSSVSGPSLHWGSHEVSPMCNCLRNVHVEYVKTVSPGGVPVPAANLTALQPNITSYRNDIKDKCFKKVRPTQVEDVAQDILSTNLISVTLFWNCIGLLVALFLFFFDAVVPIALWTTNRNQAIAQKMPVTPVPTILGVGCCPSSAVLPLFVVFAVIIWALMGALATLAHQNAKRDDTVNFSFAVYYLGVPLGPLVAMSYLIWQQQNNPEVSALNRMLYSNGSDNKPADVHPHPIRRSIGFWSSYGTAVPLVATAMNMLLQRRDWMLNISVILSVWAVCMCPLALEMVHHFYAYVEARTDVSALDASQQQEAVYQCAILHRGKNMVIKIVMVMTAIVVAMLYVATIPAFQPTVFSNASYAVLVCSALLALPLISPARHLTHLDVSDFQKSPSGAVHSRVWDMFPMDPMTLEMISRFIFTFAVLCDLWAVADMDFVRSH